MEPKIDLLETLGLEEQELELWEREEGEFS